MKYSVNTNSNSNSNSNSKLIYGQISPWNILQSYHVYRFFLSCILLIFNFVETAKIWAGKPDLRLYLYTTIIYMVLNLFFTALTQFRKPAYQTQAIASFTFEIIITTILIHASGGSLSWISFLMIITVAVSCVAIPGKPSYFITLLAIIGLFGENLINTKFNYNDIGFPFVSTLSTIILVLAFMTNIIAKRAKYSEALAEERGAELATLEQLNAHIVSAIRIGIVIIANNDSVRLINSAARYMLGISEFEHPKHLNELPKNFQLQYRNQKANPEQNLAFSTDKNAAEIRIFLKSLSDNIMGGTLVFIHDIAKERQRAEILKLKSLDRLAANIAHEIRNPLNAISHAAQLLSESSNIDEHDIKLLHIITSHCSRVNSIIQSIQILSKRNPSEPTKIGILCEIQQIIQELSYRPSHAHNNELFGHATYQTLPSQNGNDLTKLIKVECNPTDLTIEFDKGQFSQVLLNLCENGLRYSEKSTGVPTLKIKAIHYTKLHETHIDIIDNGPGPSEETVAFLFDPFFTTETTGSGLGLYISKELCQANGSRLVFSRLNDGSSCFRIIVPDGAGDLVHE